MVEKLINNSSRERKNRTQNWIYTKFVVEQKENTVLYTTFANSKTRTPVINNFRRTKLEFGIITVAEVIYLYFFHRLCYIIDYVLFITAKKVLVHTRHAFLAKKNLTLEFL